MRPFAIFLLIGILLAGCTTAPSAPAEAAQPAGQTPPQGGVANATPAANASAQTCEEYCAGLPHVQCEGSWNVSGSYPSCECSFVCLADNASGNESGGAKPPDEPLATPTNKSVSELLQDALDAQKDKFYRENSGSYSEKTYTWLREASGGMFMSSAPASDVLFDGNAIATIQASGFISFENSGTGVREAYGAAIFNSSSTILDSYTGSDAFSIDYSPKMIDQKLRDCWVYSKDYNIDKAGGWLLTYLFRCERVLDK